MDHLNFGLHAQIAEKIGVNFLHVDIMDGNFVPRYGVYPEIVRAMSYMTSLKMDLHLMVSDLEFTLREYDDIPSIEYISIHMDNSTKNLPPILDKIREKNRKAVLVIDFATDINHAAQYVSNDLIDGVMFMGIHPGVLKQKHRPDLVVKKIEKMRSLCDMSKLVIQCDGGVSFESIPNLKQAGINNFVCGSSTLYKNCDFSQPAEVVEKIISDNLKKIRDVADV